jgi:hypothetical protein
MDKNFLFDERFVAIVTALYDVISDTMILRDLEAKKRPKARIKTQPIPFYRLGNKISTEIYALEEKGGGTDEHPTYTLTLREVATKRELGYVPHVYCSVAHEPDTLVDALDTLATFIYNRKVAIADTKAKINDLDQKLQGKDQANNLDLRYEWLFYHLKLGAMETNDMLVAEGYPVDKTPINQ